jgi:hypothetical protein
MPSYNLYERYSDPDNPFDGRNGFMHEMDVEDHLMRLTP